jgi:hypothetical protein
LLASPQKIVGNSCQQARQKVRRRRKARARVPIVLEFPKVRINLHATLVAQIRRHAPRVEARPPAHERHGEPQQRGAHSRTSRRLARGETFSVEAFRASICLLVRRGPFHAIDDEHIDRACGRFQFEPELVLHRGEE